MQVSHVSGKKDAVNLKKKIKVNYLSKFYIDFM